MKSIIIYGSEYGTTEKYALELSRRTDIKAVSYDKVQNIGDYSRVIYLGGLYAGGVKGLKHIIKSLQPNMEFMIATVGLADVLNKENTESIMKSLRKQMPESLYRTARIFHLRGGIDYKKLSVKHRTMMTLLYNSVRKTPEEKRTAEAAALVETYGQKVEFIDYSTLQPIVEAINENGIAG